MKKEIEMVRQHKWNAMFNINETYDFGLLTVNCLPFKQDVINHCIVLERYLEEVVRQEFLEQMRRV